MSAEDNTALRKAAHPAPGWIAVVPIPGAREQAEEPGAEIHEALGLTILGLKPADPGINAAVVIEVGPLAGPVEELIPGIEKDAKVYYSGDRGIIIGEYTYIAVSSVIAWEEA